MSPALQTTLTTGKSSEQRQIRLQVVLALAGIGLLVYSQFFCFTPLGDVVLGRLALSRAAGIGLLAAALLLLLEDAKLPWFAPGAGAAGQETPGFKTGWLRLAAALVGLALPVLASRLAGVELKGISPLASGLAWLCGIGLVAWAGWQGPFSRPRAPRGVWLAGLGITAAALLLRLVSLQTIPAIFTGDEAGFGRVAQQILRGETTNLFSAPFMGGTNLPFLYDLIQAGALVVFGRSAEGFRVTSALAGGLTVLALFCLALRWFGRRTAVFAALILAGNHLHLHFSRYAISNVFDGLFFVLVMGLVWDAWESGERKKYLLAGLALGFSQYFYTSARALPVAALAFFAAAAVVDRRRVKSALGSMGFFWAAFLVVFLPMILYYIQAPNMFIAPWSRVGQDTVKTGGLLSAFRPEQLAGTVRQIYRGLLGFTVLDLKWLYKPDAAILRALPALVFLAGAAALLARRRWSQLLLLGLWLAAFGFIGGLSDSTPAAQRYVAAVPALALVAGYGLKTLADAWAKVRPERTRLGLALAVGLALLLFADDARFYFFQYTPKTRYDDPNGLAVQRLADYLQSKDSSVEVVFVGYPSMHYGSIPTLQFLNPQITRVVSIHSLEELDQALKRPPDHRVYFFTYGRRVDYLHAQQALPGGTLTTEKNIWLEPAYWIYETEP